MRIGKCVLLLNARAHRQPPVCAAMRSSSTGLLSVATAAAWPGAVGTGSVRLWQIDSDACLVLGHTDEVFAAAFHPDGRRLATAGRDRAVWLWDLAQGEEVARLQGHTSYVWSLAFSPDGATLASRLWRLHGPTLGHDTHEQRYQAQREARPCGTEAERLVERLWRQKDDPAEIIENAPGPPRAERAAQRHAAQLAVLRAHAAAGI